MEGRRKHVTVMFQCSPVFMLAPVGVFLDYIHALPHGYSLKAETPYSNLKINVSTFRWCDEILHRIPTLRRLLDDSAARLSSLLTACDRALVMPIAAGRAHVFRNVSIRYLFPSTQQWLLPCYIDVGEAAHLEHLSMCTSLSHQGTLAWTYFSVT